MNHTAPSQFGIPGAHIRHKHCLGIIMSTTTSTKHESEPTVVNIYAPIEVITSAHNLDVLLDTTRISGCGMQSNSALH
jgi:hypothetical protein